MHYEHKTQDQNICKYNLARMPKAVYIIYMLKYPNKLYQLCIRLRHKFTHKFMFLVLNCHLSEKTKTISVKHWLRQLKIILKRKENLWKWETGPAAAATPATWSPLLRAELHVYTGCRRTCSVEQVVSCIWLVHEAKRALLSAGGSLELGSLHTRGALFWESTSHQPRVLIGYWVNQLSSVKWRGGETFRLVQRTTD